MKKRSELKQAPFLARTSALHVVLHLHGLATCCNTRHLVAAATKVEEHELDAILPGLGLLGGLVAILERGAVAAATQELEQDGLDATLLLLLLGLLGRLAATPEPDAAEAAKQELEQDGFRAILLPELLVLGLLVLLVHLQLAPILPVVLAIWTAREEVYEQALSHLEGNFRISLLAVSFLSEPRWRSRTTWHEGGRHFHPQLPHSDATSTTPADADKEQIQKFELHLSFEKLVAQHNWTQLSKLRAVRPGIRPYFPGSSHGHRLTPRQREGQEALSQVAASPPRQQHSRETLLSSAIRRRVRFMMC